MSRGAEDGEVTVSISDVPLIQIALSSYAASLRRQARSKKMEGRPNLAARAELRDQAARAARVASEIGRR